MNQDFSNSPTLSAAATNALGAFFAFYDVAADGQRFLMIKSSVPDPGAQQMNVVLNWFEELKQRVPVR